MCRWKYTRTINLDGNFKAEHMRMRHPDNDIPIADGTGFMVGTRRYKDYLTETAEEKRVRSLLSLATCAHSQAVSEKHVQQPQGRECGKC